MKLSQLDTPCLMLNRETLLQNAQALTNHIQSLGVNLRPHMKTAKSIDVAKIALEGKPCESISGLLDGMTVLSFSEDPVAAAKVTEEYAKENDKLVILGGSMGDNALDRAGVKAVAAMPSREELIASIVGCIAAPASNIAGAFGAPASNIASILETIEEKAA